MSLFFCVEFLIVCFLVRALFSFFVDDVFLTSVIPCHVLCPFFGRRVFVETVLAINPRLSICCLAVGFWFSVLFFVFCSFRGGFGMGLRPFSGHPPCHPMIVGFSGDGRHGFLRGSVFFPVITPVVGGIDRDLEGLAVNFVVRFW